VYSFNVKITAFWLRTVQGQKVARQGHKALLRIGTKNVTAKGNVFE